MIRKIRNKRLWKVESEDTNRNFGVYRSRKKAENRLRQIEYFKHKKLKRSLR